MVRFDDGDSEEEEEENNYVKYSNRQSIPRRDSNQKQENYPSAINLKGTKFYLMPL